MAAALPIRILAPATQTGDLFARLVAKLFVALGYEQPRLNVHKTGREIDVQARHRTEPRSVRAECKATARPVGAGMINKFAGALEIERRKAPNEPVSGYFISLAGFTESARELEREVGDPVRMTLLDGRQLIDELIAGRILVSREKAFERAGRCTRQAADLTVGEAALLAHDHGWIWMVRFRRHAEATHFALIDQDGEALSATLARRIVAADRRHGGDLHRLTYLAPESVQLAPEALFAARQAYLSYLATECAEIEVEDLPADQQVRTRRLALESLFVPVRLLGVPPSDRHDLPGRAEQPLETPPIPRAVGEALAAQPRLAILAHPGGGKTTLINRLATYYAFPDRRTELGDRLPDRQWFPLLLRCRQLRGRTDQPILRLLEQLGERAEMNVQLVDAFQGLVQTLLQEARALLLVDGLDEISDQRERTAFVAQLRILASTYPDVAFVITSREAGFRPLAGALAGLCAHYRIADFDRDDVERLTVAWHRELDGHVPEVDAQARRLAQAIWASDRVRRLAVNPLLLTTLLRVRRWVGELPRRRTVLYDKAIEVLLWTWNPLGQEPLDAQEVVPQLAFVAWQMMEDGALLISKPRLRATLEAARKQMPDVLAHASLGVEGFVERVEGRSGLLVLAGHDIEDGRLVPVYGFQHPTFQEFLAAHALVAGYYPNRSAADSLVSKLERHFRDEAWKEVIPLAAVLAGRSAAPLMRRLVESVEHGLLLKSRTAATSTTGMMAVTLAQCLLDDVHLEPQLIERGLLVIATLSQATEYHLYQLASGKYGDLLREIIWKRVSAASEDFFSQAHALRVAGFAGLHWSPMPEQDPALVAAVVESVDSLLHSDDQRERALGLVSLTQFSFTLSSSSAYTARLPAGSPLPRWMPAVVTAINSEHPWEQIAGTWALAWLTWAGVQPAETVDVIQRLLDLLSSAKVPDVANFCAWAVTQVQPPPARVSFRPPSPAKAKKVLSMLRSHEDPGTRFGQLFAAFYWRLPWTDKELGTMFQNALRSYPINRFLMTNLHTILDQLGEPARGASRLFRKLLRTQVGPA
jgi:hypothetical protein